MCAQLDKYAPSITLSAQRLIAMCRKVRLEAHRLIVRLITRRLGLQPQAHKQRAVIKAHAPGPPLASDLVA
jgi:hypothetical protein